MKIMEMVRELLWVFFATLASPILVDTHGIHREWLERVWREMVRKKGGKGC